MQIYLYNTLKKLLHFQTKGRKIFRPYIYDVSNLFLG